MDNMLDKQFFIVIFMSIPNIKKIVFSGIIKLDPNRIWLNRFKNTKDYFNLALNDFKLLFLL